REGHLGLEPIKSLQKKNDDCVFGYQVEDKRIGVVLQSIEATLAAISTPFSFQGHTYRWHSDHGPLIPIMIAALPLAIVYSRIKAALRTYGQVLNLSKLYTVDGDWLGNWTAVLSTSPDTECPPSIKFHGIEGLFNVYQSTGLTPCTECGRLYERHLACSCQILPSTNEHPLPELPESINNTTTQSTGSSHIATSFSENNERVEIEIPFSEDEEFFAPSTDEIGTPNTSKNTRHTNASNTPTHKQTTTTPDIDISSLSAALENADVKRGLTRAEIPPNTDKSTRCPRSAKLPINYKERGAKARQY
ncbi:hypothetical protein H4219_006335, partial [Mycoemilia scoparia]